MDVTITELPALRLVGYRCFGRLGELPDRVHPAWRGLAKEAPTVAGLLEPGIFYGVMPDADHLRPPPDGVYIYWTAVRIAPNAPFPKGMGQLLVPAARYAVTRVRGTEARIPETYTALAEWLGANGEAPAPGGWALERYDERRQSVIPPYPTFDYDILRPLAPR
jgi:predicted transcriptional regulator YdeE